jgi:ribosomal protein S20
LSITPYALNSWNRVNSFNFHKSYDKLDRNRNRANDYLKKTRVAVQDGDLIKATEDLKEAEKRFSDLKGMIELTQADRVSQQTNLLNRILDTHDSSAGARK